MSDLIFAELRPQEGATHELADGTTVGREGCDVILDDPEVSRQHAIVRLVGGTAAIEDQESRNGTFVNGERIEGGRALAVGDTVRFGSVEWRFEGAAGAGETLLASSPPPAADPAATVAVSRPEPAAPPEPQPEPPPPPEPVPAPTALSGARGDVPAPPDPRASAVQPSPQPSPSSAPAFQEPAGAKGGAIVGASAAERTGATVVALLIVLADAIALIAYFALS